MACSQYHYGKSSPALSRIRVIKFDAKGKNFPTVCSHCSKPLCMSACRLGAIKTDTSTGAVIIDEDLCVGCLLCIPACPFSQISLHPENRTAFKCDLCSGDPQCAKFCPIGAVSFSDMDKFVMDRKLTLVTK
jgi:Fe-S-cluster-containing hydrogenase component 2